MGVYTKSHSQPGVEARSLVVVEPSLGARLGKRSLGDTLRVKFTLYGYHEDVKYGTHTWFPATNMNKITSPTLAVTVEGYNKGNENKPNRKAVIQTAKVLPP